MSKTKAVAPAAVAPKRANEHPHTGSKPVGIAVRLCNDETMHFPTGCSWRWWNVFGVPMLEVLTSDNAVVFQTPRENVYYVSGPGYTQPLWGTRTYPLPT